MTSDELGDRLIVGPQRNKADFPESGLPGDIDRSAKLSTVDFDRFALVDEHDPLRDRSNG